LLQNFIPAYYHETKKFQAALLNSDASVVSPVLASVSQSLPSASSSSASSLTCFPVPNSHRPMAFTVDGVSTADHESYICITAHWLDPGFIPKSALLDISLCTDRHHQITCEIG
jgi:hypothetical protein